MTSYMYNPSQKVTDILSKFLEFDEEQLELGIWSGDLSLKNVNLRQDAVQPLLNKKANKPHTDPLKKAPLHMKLVSGTVGNMRIRIPWKRLVWGQGAVQLEISDVMIVLSLQSREETERQQKASSVQKDKKKKKKEQEQAEGDESGDVSASYREAKQRRLREAERRHLHGLPVALWLENVHRKNSIAKEAAKTDEENAKKSKKKEKKDSLIGEWFKNSATDLFWRFFAGLHGSIRKARIVVVQDGVEVGCIVQSIEVIAGKDGTKISVNESSERTEEMMEDADIIPPEDFVFESAYDDGEHVDKTIKQQGLGIFVRKEASMAKVPPALRFSTSVSADDYVLRPVDLDLSFSFFYPHPPERRKKRTVDNQSQDTPLTAQSSSQSVGASTTTSAKRRRGKRERVAAPSITSTTGSSTAIQFEDRRKPGLKRSTSHSSLTMGKDRVSPMLSGADHSQRFVRSHRRMMTDNAGIGTRHGSGGDVSRPGLKRYQSTQPTRSSSLMNGVHDGMSIMESPTIAASERAAALNLVPRFECRVSLQEIRVVFSNRHYELLNYFFSTLKRMKNGRPDQAIRSVRDSDATAFRRQILEEEPISPKSAAAKPTPATPSTLGALVAPLTNYLSSSTPAENEDSRVTSSSDIKVHAPLEGIRSAKSEVTRKWWTYSIEAILWELRKRKRLTTNFRQMYISFDWSRQRYKRQEYIDVYIALKLDKIPPEKVWPFEEEDGREEMLLQIEDELPLEQILLYRSIARSIRVKGVTKMPATVHELHKNRTLRVRGLKTRRSSVRTPGIIPRDTGETTFLSLLQNKFDMSRRVRLDGGMTERFQNPGQLKKKRHQAETDQDLDVLSSEAAQNPARKASIGFDSAAQSDSGRKTPRKMAISSSGRKASLGFDSVSDIKPGNFYTTGNRRDSVADGRTIKTSKKESRHTRSTMAGETVGQVSDGRMRINFSLQVKCIDLMIIQEDYFFEMSPEMQGGNKGGRMSPDARSRDYDDDDEDSSSDDDLSDLSVLTDDERFFNDPNQIGAPVEEESENGGAKLSSTDFLSFGLPENLLLRLTISSLGTYIRGKGGGPMHLAVSVGRINAVADGDCRILSIGLSQPGTPIAEVNVETPGHKRSRSNDSMDFDFSSHRGPYQRQDEFSTPGRLRQNAPSRAVSLLLCIEDGSKSVQCDFSKIGLNVDLDPAVKLLKFVESSKIVYPNKILAKSSRDVARKFMVYKTSNSSKLRSLSTAIRVHGLEISVPFTLNDASASEASSLDSRRSDYMLGNEATRVNPKNCTAVLVAETVEVYSGDAVDEIVAGSAIDLGQSPSSLWSSIFASKRSTAKTMEMLDIVELTSSHDSFACTHWVATIGGIDCVLNTEADILPQLTDVPIDIELLLTMNETSLLETESPKHQIVVEVSPVHVILSEHRLDLISAAKSALDFSVFTSAAHLQNQRQKPDPPRIEILSRRILNSLDLSCKRMQIALVVDDDPIEPLSLKYKGMIMEECLSDFLSVVSCFDFSLPNEEALSSAMQVCIGRLVGLGLTDDEAWGCTNAARLNFLDDIALMRRAQTDVLVQLSSSLRKESVALNRVPLEEASDESEDPEEFDHSFDYVEESLANSSHANSSHKENDEQPASVGSESTEGVSDEDSANSVDIVETTLNNAVEKTVATFSLLLQGYHCESRNVKSILAFDMPLGLRLSMVKLFYDTHLTFIITSLVMANSAGIELLTLVPHFSDSDESLEEDQEAPPGHGICFSRFDLDKDYDFGKGGLAMSVLASDKGADTDLNFRERARSDDIDIGEIEVLFSANIYETIIDDISRFGKRKAKNDAGNKEESQSSLREKRPDVESSSVIVASSFSMLFTSDQLVPFSRLTLENLSYRNKKALESLPTSDIPTWIVLAESMVLQNLTPEGQFYPDVLALLSTSESTGFPFQLRYFKSPDPWEFSNRLQVEFTGFRLYLFRQFLYEVIHYFINDKYGVGYLKKKYSKDVRDINGNQKPPMLWSVKVRESSVICPRCSSSSDMACFEVEEVNISVNYIPESFKMPTESTFFEASPPPENGVDSKRFCQTNNRMNSFISLSEFQDCLDESISDDSDNGSSAPVSAFSKNLKKRLAINLNRVRIFTAIAKDKATRDIVESPLFRFFYGIDGRAGPQKVVYARRENVERQPSVSPESLMETEKCEQYWEEISTNLLDIEVFFDSAPHTRLFIGNREGPNPFSLDARMSQLCLLLSVWDSNMQELPTMFPFNTNQVSENATPPKIPDNFPKYGTEEFVSHLEDLSVKKSEICCMFKKLSLRCTYDEPGHFPVDPGCFQYFDDPWCPDDIKPGSILTLDDAVIHVINDFQNVKRIGIGASSIELIDERRNPVFQRVLNTSPRDEKNGNYQRPPAWADVGWGLRNDVRTLSSSLPQPVQFSVFMYPGWSLINLGAQNLNGIMMDLSWIWTLLDFFKSYYSDVAFGNPGHQAQRWAHKVKNSLRKSNGESTVKFVPLPGVNIDFRLWVCRPILCLPSEYTNPNAPCLRLDSKTGLRYRFKKIRDLSSHEVASTDLNLHIASGFQSPQSFRFSDIRDTISGVRSLVEGLSFGLRYDCNNLCNHKDVSVLIPFAGDKIPSLNVSGQELEVDPVALEAPIVCKPFEQPTRTVGPKVCEITCIIEVLPITSATMMNFFKGPAEINEDFAQEEEDQAPPTYSVAAKIADLRVFAIDPVLGVQLPVAVASLAAVSLTATKFAVGPTQLKLKHGESPPDDLQVTVNCHLWADYFKLGMTRSWEPLLEPFDFLLLYEKSKERGQGFTLDADSPFHVNLSGALLQMLGETIDSFSKIVNETFGDRATSHRAMRRSVAKASPSKDRVGAMIEDSINTRDGNEVTVLHEIPKPLKRDDRVAFSLRNLTGQKIRIHQQTDLACASTFDKSAIITYLNQTESMGLTFAATISVIKNLTIVEVPYPGLPNSRSSNQNQGSLNHAVDVQVPGFRWIQGIKVDTFGRKFETITPRSTDVLAKVFRDWRLRNAMMLLTEVGLDSGGRLVTVRSLFEVRNNTTHAIKLVYNPDPRHEIMEVASNDAGLGFSRENDVYVDGSVTSVEHLGNSEEIAIIQPGDVFQIPTLLLERALQMAGSHLGCLWLCPDTKDKSLPFWEFFRASGSAEKGSEIQASFCSRPIQLAKIVYESSVIFQNRSGEDIPADDAKSGVQVSCPTRSRGGDGPAPFCYAIEVGRSPLININRDKALTESKDSSQTDSGKGEKKTATVTDKTSGADKKAKRVEKIHGPVAYTLSVHAPLVVVNLLPAEGRFELMHAVRKTVLWYADLQPGQQIPVHSVGLDAPLLLLVNIGFCRTPVGEGALVHHGVDSEKTGKEQGVGFKKIGKAAIKGTKQIGKTLTAMSDSPDKRGQLGMAKAINTQHYSRENHKEKAKQSKLVEDGDLGLDTGVGGMEVVDGKVHSVETMTYSANDVATETTVVDGVGQRLTLSIENTRGGGGQRRVSLFCPFWIVNTTEHALRYKQDKVKTFVSGTVLSLEKDGSRPVDGSNRNYRNFHKLRNTRQSSRRVTMDGDTKIERTAMNSKTIFSGTPGALATAPGKCDLPASELAELIDKDVSLEKLADLAFMFNFHDEGMSIGNQMLCAQLYDGTGQSNYTSDWSRGFSLESVGFSQIVGMQCKEGRTLELSVEVNVAPGFLSAYTKIVRFLPRYVVFNRLDRPIRLWQDSSVFRPVSEDRAATASDTLESSKDSRKWRYDFEDKHHHEKISQYEQLYGRPGTIDDRKDSLKQKAMRVNPIPDGTTAHRSALYVTSMLPSELAPFILPDSRAERQLRVDLGGIFNVTSSFASNLPGEHTLKVSRATDARLLKHVSTRAAPKYKIVLPPPGDAAIGDWDGELGVFFETDWGGDRRIIVKGTRRGKYAFNHTDIHVGDELLRVDGVSVVRMSFSETMKLIKERLAYISSLHVQRKRRRQKKKESKRGSKRGMLLRRLSAGVSGVVRKERRFSGGGYSRQSSADGNVAKPAQLTLTFRTLEERLRKLRLKASRDDGLNRSRHNPLRPGLERGMSARTLQSATDQQNSIESEAEVDSISVEMKSLHNTMFVILRPQDKENPLFRIQNRSINHIVFYRQRGCDGHPWNQLMPGESLPYAWEEPMRSKKLTVRVAAKSQDLLKADFQGSSHDLSDLESVDNDEPEFVTSADQEKQTARAARLRQSLAYQFVDTEERGGYGPSIVIKLEEIGYRNFLPVPSKEGGRKRRKFLNCEVDTDGGTRLLVVSDDSNAEDERSTLNRHLETLRKQISFEQERQAGLLSLRSALSKPDLKNSLRSVGETTEENEGVENDTQVEREASIEADAKRLVEDYPEESTISSRHQVVVEVLETAGLNASDFVGSCNPYCEVFLKGRSKSRQHFFQKRKNKRKTFFIEKSLNPKWTDQVFVFDVTEEAVMVTRGHSIQVKVRNFRLVGGHPIMGHASVHFGSLRNQQELSGWYPLAGRTGRSDVETAKFSDGSRGSIKLRVQWVYSTPALIDYFLLLSERHLEQLTKSRKGMMDQLSHAIESDQRKREARDQLNSGRIQKLAKLQKKELRVTSARNVKEGEKVVGKKVVGKKVVGKINQAVNQGLNSSISVLKDTMKASRDRYLYALYFQTVESRKNRQMKEQEETEETQDLASHNDSVGHSMNLAELPMITEQKSPGSLAGSLASSKRTLEDFLSQQRAKTITQSPRHAENGNKKTLGDFFAQNRDENQDDTEERQKSPFLSPSGRARRSLLGEIENGRRPQNHRRLSLDIDEPLYEENGNGEQIDQARSSLYQNANFYDNLYGQTPDFASISDLISVGTDVDEEAKRAKAIKALRMLGFVFHDSGVYFHEDHLPHHFRRSLFASSMEERKSVRLYRPKFAVGTASAMRHFKTWQAAQALHLDPELDVVRTDDAFLICFKEKTSSPPKKKLNISASKSAIVETLAVPEMSPITTIARAQSRVETMHLSRSRFERACKRTLGAVLNPGGWLTIRPITVLNLPDTYTGMFVKLRYGSGVLVSETVDAKVTPRWTAPDSFDSPVEGKATRGRRRSAATVGPVENEKFEFNENDLHVHVEPQQTSGAIKISVVAERLNTKTELGVLQIPLGAAIAACIDSAESMGDSDPIENSTGPPMYIRWFPLTNPRLAVPVEGDMGLSNRPKESEQLRDNMFQQYFAPCIQLALIWWPDGNKPDDKEAEGSYSESSSGALAVRGPSGSAPATMTPLIQNYFNADVGRISAALIDSQRAVELLSFSALDIDMRYSVTKTKTRIGLVVGWIQLDHQDNRAREPVVLAPTPAEHLQPTLQLLALKDNLRTKSNIVSYEYIGVALQEMDLTVEESWVFELWDFFMGVMRRNQAKKNKTKGQKRADLILTENCFTASDLEDSVAPSLLSILEGAGEEGSAAAKRKVYVEQLILGLVKVNLSYVKGKKQSWELTDEGAKAMKNLEVKELLYLENVARNDQSEVFVKWSQHTYDEDLLAQSGGTYNLPGIIAAVFPSVSDAPIRLQGKAIDHVFESPGEILSSIKNFYVNETLKQVYKIIGSLDFVGNPTIIFSSFVSGVRDLVVAPTTAFLKSPTNVNQVGIGVAKGTISLFSHSASGIFGFAAKMSATAGQAAAILSLDAEYREWHRDRIVSEATNLNRVWKRRGVQSVSEMLTRPVGDILLGIAMGASGLFISPYRGFRKNGKWGFVQGVASGTAGVVAKPLVGVLDAFTHFSATAHDIAKSVNVLERRYQPAFKLRLPYAFGPMNILSPFDPVTARSMYLLKIFPPKSKRNHRRNERAREIHVHSEVLHMEPGVETYAIATTIRVVLLKLKKDANGTLSPSFAWEVDLTGDASVSSRVSDHGHNGVALTITKHGKDGKKGDTTKAVKSKGGRGAPLVQETVQETHLSSALSVDSEFSDLDSDFEARLDDPVGDDLQQGRVTFEEPLSENDIETSYHEHGAMKRGGEVSEWFTVLAEYQHRRQLTILHNAISCIVGDFNAVIVGGRHELDHGSEGVTDFGIFGFDANLQGGKAAYASNAVLVNALENLPWIHENVFKKVNGKSRSRQRDFVSTLRQNWVFSSELEASMAQGGPSWLIEARARAMFVSSEAPPVPEFVDPDDPVVKKLLLELEQGHISFEQAAELLHSSNEDSFSSEEDVDIPEAAEIRLRDNVEAQRHTENADDLVLTSLEMPKNEGDGVLDNRDLSGDRDASQIRDVGSAAREDAAAGVFHSIEFQYPISGLGGDAKKSASGPEHIERLSVPADNASMSGNDFVDFKSPLNDLEEQDAAVGDSTVKTGSPFSSPNLPTKETVQTRSNQFVEKPQPSPARDTRMDRMETLLEQLVIINAQQVQKSIVPTDVISDNNSTATSNIADTLKHELADLRAQVLARAKEDDALRGEIHALRRQLAKRRDEDLSQKSSRPANKGIKLPEILRFGHSGKKNERESDQSPTKDVSRRQESKPESVEAVSPDVGRINERGGSGQKMSRRLSGGSIDQGFGRMNRQGSASGQRMPRRLSNDLVELEVDQGSGRMNRRGSASGQRMPRQLSNDSEKLEVIVLDREGTGSGRAMPRRPSNDSMNLGVG